MNMNTAEYLNRVQTILELSNLQKFSLEDEEDYPGTYAKKFPTSKFAH